MHKIGDRRPLQKLLPKHLTFCSEYVLDLNGTRAAQAAGYTKKSAPRIAHFLIRDQLIKAEIGRLKAKALATAGITPAFVLEDLRAIIEEVKSQKTPAFYQVRIRANELLGKHLNLWDNSNHDTHRRASELTDKELVALGMQLAQGMDKQPIAIEAVIEDKPDSADVKED